MSTLIAFIGVGNMGCPMAENLMKAGQTVKVFDVSKKILKIAKNRNLKTVETLNDLITADVRTVTHTVNSTSNTVNVTVQTNAAKSDMRLKTNIDRIGYSDMNIPIYLFNYKDDLNTTYKGVMAQDLLELGFNSGVILDSDGYYSVDYNSIDVDMERV